MQHGELRSDRGSWLVIEFFLQACLLQHPWHLQGGRLIILHLSSSSSTASTMTSSTVSSDSETQSMVKIWVGSIPIQYLCQVHMLKGYRMGRPVDQANQKSKTKFKRRPRSKNSWDLLNSYIPEWLQEFRENLVDDRAQRLTRQFFSWTIFRAYTCEKCGFG